jgi:hypothetical protein
MELDEQARRSAELEDAIEAVEHGRHLLCALDKRLNQTREGVNAVKKLVPIHQSFLWVLRPGAIFVRGTKRQVLSALEDDSCMIKDRIDTGRDELKERVTRLAHLEGLDCALARLNAGFDLRPINYKQ